MGATESCPFDIMLTLDGQLLPACLLWHQNGVLDVMEDACNGLLSNILSEKLGEIEQPPGAIAAASKAAAVCAQRSADNGARTRPV